MTSRRRNFLVILAVLGLLAAASAVIASKPTRLGLDLKGGIELVYEGRPTPKVPSVTPQAIDDAIETIRKRTDALGVAEPEIQAAGRNQISIGLPDVQDPDRAIKQVGTTAQLQFYDWEANVFGDGEAPIPSLYEAVVRASKQKPKADAEDIPPGAPNDAELRAAGISPTDQAAVREFYDRRNDTSRSDLYYLFGPGEGAERKLLAGPEANCEELLSGFEEAAPGAGGTGGESPTGREAVKNSECQTELGALGAAGPPAGSRVLKVPRGIVVVQAERPENFPPNREFNQYFVIEDDSELSGSEVENPEQNIDPRDQQPVVTMQFSDRGKKAFEAVTKRLARRGSEVILPPGAPPANAFQRFAITLDRELISRATIDFVENPEGIDGRTGVQIENIGTLQEVQDLAENLRIGALPIELKLISQTKVSATLGKQALNQGLLAGLAGLALTLLFLMGFYRVLGVVSALGLLTYAVFLFALIELIPITMTLPGIAGTILTLGVAADANIVIFERIKEEARAGASIPRAISAGYGKALRTIIDANVVTIGVAFILFMLATAGVKGFAFTLGVGTLVSLFTAVLATSAILGSIARTRLLRSRFALGAGEERVRWRFDFTGGAKWFFSMSGLIIAAGALAIAGLGINFGIDFESGTRIKTPLERPATVEQVRDAISPAGYGDAEIQEVEEPELGQHVFQISTETLQPGEEGRVRDALDERFGVRAADFSANTIGPTFGAQIAQTAVIAIIASLFLISLYIGLRFEFKFAVPVLIALAHDLLITAGVYALTEREVTSSTVAALLTILGFSLYDTIIVFDRIRENVPRMPRATFSQIVNRSMSEVLTRSLVTSLSTLIPVTALMLFGGETLKDFGFALLVGVASGTYSSVFIAAPVLTAWKEREPVYRRRRQVVMEDHGGIVPAFAETALGTRGDEEAGAEPRRPRPATRARRAAAGRRARPPRPAGAEAEAPGDGPGGRPAPTTREVVSERGDGGKGQLPAEPADVAPDRGDGGAAQSPPEPRDAAVPPARSPSGDGAPPPDADGDGRPSSPAVSSTGPGAQARKQKQRNRPRKKHGRR